ncbi:hypothetical protein [Bizionia paragorgiae]|uniref:hypothetical protein n=1 Tax=Bizionia paragorgiae TaxID=283786 RepID=UPI003A93AA99
MEEFFRQNYFLLTNSTILIAVFAGLFSIKKYKGSPESFFIIIIFYLFAIELIGNYPRLYGKIEFLEPLYNSVFRKNYWWYTLAFDIGVILLFSVLYQKIIKSIAFKRVIKVATILYFGFSVIFILINYQDLFKQTFPVFQLLGALIILMCCAFYLFELLQSDAVLQMHKHLYFYITIAIFLWWIIVTPLTFYDLYFRSADWNFIILKWQIHLFANMFMYFTFSFALWWCKPEFKKIT